jgi:outer membrane protein TolC
MRLYQQIRASIVRSAVVGAGAVLFISGMPLSASGQTAAAPPSQAGSLSTPVTVQGTPLSIEEAVRMGLENNLGVQIERLNPQIQVLGISRASAAFTPALFSSLTRTSNTSPPTDFNTSAENQSISTNGNFNTSGGMQQNLRWGGAAYSLAFSGSRTTTNNINVAFNPQLGSGLNAVYTQPLLRNFKIDTLRQQLMLSQNQAQAADIHLQERVTQTARNIRASYYQLVGAISGLEVAQQSLDVARTSLKNNQTRVEVGTMAKIDIVTAEAEVASNEESVIVAQANIESAQDQLRTLVMNPNQPDFWGARFTPSEQPTLAPREINVDAAIKNALENRTDIREFRKNMESTDINLAYARNQKLPAIDLNARYGLTGVAGTQLSREGTSTLERSFFDAMRDVFANDFKTWSFGVNVSYPIGTSIADAAYAQAKLQKQSELQSLENLRMGVTTQVRQAARDVNTNLRRVEATRRARELAEQRLDADNKRFAVGLATTFELLQSQRDLARAKQNELRATIDYNQSLVDFEAVQISPIR